MKTTREMSREAVPGGERFLMIASIAVFACAVYLGVALTRDLHLAKPLTGVVSALAGPICFILSVRELTRYRKNWWTITAAVASGLAVAIAWGAVVLVVLGKIP